MSTWNEGDIVTLEFDGESYLLAKVIYVEKLTLHDVLHLMVYDILLEAGPEGYDRQGEYVPRTHDLPDLSQLNVVIDHFAMTSPSFLECDPLVVEYEEVTEQERKGYVVWVTLRRDSAVRKGLIKHDLEEEVEDEYEGDEEWGEEEGDEEQSADADGSTEENTDENEGDDSEYEEVKIHTWHDTVFELPIGQALVELADIFRSEEFAESRVGTAVIEQTEASGEVIHELVRQLVEDGDYGAGQELLIYGDAAADALNEALSGELEQQTLEDIYQIMGDLGSDRAYEHIAARFVESVDRLPDDQKAIAAARSFCYVVMLTGGAVDPLQPHLRLLERLDYPDLRDDAESAIDAINSQGTGIPDPDAAQNTSKDPFGF